MNIILFRLYLFCVAAVLLSCRFRAKMSNHYLRLSSGSTIPKQTSRWSSGHPTSFDAAVELAPDKLLLSLCLHGCERVMVTRREFHFGWVYTFFVQLSSLRNWCTLTRETSCGPAAPLRAVVWIILQTSPFNCVATVVIFFVWPFNWNVSLMLVCLGTPDLITVLFFRCPGRLFTMKMKMQYLPYRQ